MPALAASARSETPGRSLLDLTKPHVAEAVATIAPAVPSEVVDAIAEHLASVSAAERPAAVLCLAESLQNAAEASAPGIRDTVAGVTLVALDAAVRRIDGDAR